MYTLLTVHIKCIWSTNFYKFTSSVYGVWNFTSWHQVCMVNERLQVHIKCIWCTTSTSSHQVYMVYTLLTSCVCGDATYKCIWSTNFYKFTSSVYGERTPTSSHHVYVVYTLLTVHIKCIWSTNFYKFTSSVYGVWRTRTSYIMCMWCTHF